MTTRRARRTVRSAGLVAVAAAAAFSLTACQSGGNDAAAGSEKKISSSASGSTGIGGAPDGARTSADKTQISVQTGTSAAHRATAQAAAAAAAKAASPVRTQTLADGSKAEIYELGDQHYRAVIVSRGSVLATLETKGQDAGLDANDMFVVLTLSGEVHSWMGGGHTGPGTFKLAGGWTAKVTKIGELRYRAQILGNEGAVEAMMEANQHDTGLDANGVYIVLSNGGVISSHL
ncbi:hypothetical protein [Streptomyces sp. NBC_01363]|uniref:hypothetical protein n=1 Tax=Streptomyces sp. NBC_01363 TaxID=2903840 RepID=UPI002254D8BC|nr:hypothetical protein [Streptomyces sp. NBC_01363]MCX4736808.1 hypothetical protein [Streptomyces sp. NBC_01363]